MDKEEIIKIIRDEVSKEFGAERMKEIEYFGPYEDGDIDGMDLSLMAIGF